MSGLRALLREARDELHATLDIQASHELKQLVERIDAVLTKPISNQPPDLWMLLEQASEYFGAAFCSINGDREVALEKLSDLIEATLAQRDLWQLVPKEPTDDQLRAGFSAFYLSTSERRRYYESALASAIAKADAATAPQSEK